jgi:hypothetical protein
MEIDQGTVTMTRGDSETITVSCVNSNGEAVTFVEGDLIYFTIKKSISATDKVLQKIIEEFTDGTAVISIEHEDTADIEPGVYMYDIQYTDQFGKVSTIIKPSRFKIEGDVTYE